MYSNQRFNEAVAFLQPLFLFILDIVYSRADIFFDLFALSINLISYISLGMASLYIYRGSDKVSKYTNQLYILVYSLSVYMFLIEESTIATYLSLISLVLLSILIRLTFKNKNSARYYLILKFVLNVYELYILFLLIK